MPGLFLVNLARNGRPDIVISRRKELREFIAIPDWPQRAPFGFCGSVIAALNRVANVDDEIGLQKSDVAPNGFVNLWLGIAGAISQNRKPKIVAGIARSSDTCQAQQNCGDRGPVP